MIVRVAYQEAVQGLFDYLVPQDLQSECQIGKRVAVPRRNTVTTAYIVEIADRSEFKRLKPLLCYLDDQPMILPNIMKLAKWMADYYLTPLGWVLKTMLPGGINVSGTQSIAAKPELKEILEKSAAKLSPQAIETAEFILNKSNDVTYSNLLKHFEKAELDACLNQLDEMGGIRYLGRLKASKVKSKEQAAIRLLKPVTPEDVTKFMARPSPTFKEFCFSLPVGEAIFLRDLAENFSQARKYAATLEQFGYAEITQEIVRRNPLTADPKTYQAPEQLTREQSTIIDSIFDDIREQRFQVHLIHGVTGSGKTEVYLQLIKRALDLGKQACVLVPEISLTPQAVERYQGRLGQVIAVLHSALSPGERYDEFCRILEGKASVVIGARSAIFAPLENLALIIVDEEHDSSYKQDSAPCYNGRDVAIVRGKMEACPVILGSATPALESYYNATRGKFRLHSIEKRVVDRPMPPVEVIDMREEYPKGTVMGFFSHPLRQAIAENLAFHNQTLIYLNRRGFHTFGFCRKCGLVLKCPHCSVAMTFHKATENLKCHHCGYHEKPDELCPKCETVMTYKGVGTQRLEEEVALYFPEATLLRMDSDATSQKGSHERLMKKVQSGEIDILIGTKMVTKGHDIEGITLVLVLSADNELHMPDFRAAERTFQTLVQVAGRCGRGDDPGKVLVQTFQPEHYSITCGKQHDYGCFYEQEILFREMLGYPPFTRCVNILCSSPEEKRAQNLISRVRSDIVRLNLADLRIVGPAAAPLAKLNDRYRWHLLLFSPSIRSLHLAAQKANELKPPSKSQVRVDIDPIDFL